MPRIKPPPARNESPIPVMEDHTPPTEDIEIVLDDDSSGETVVELSAQPTPEPQPVPEPTPDVPVVEDNPLQKALEAQQRAEEIARAANERAADATRRANERDQEILRANTDREDAEYNSVLTTIAAEQAALDKAEADYAAYASTGDWGNAAKVQRTIATASARLDRLEDGKKEFETRRESRPASQTQPAPQPAPQDFEAKLAVIPGLPDNAKTWLRKHPEFVNDAGMNEKIGNTHNYLTKNKGVAPFSEAYFDALDNEFGFKALPTPPAAAPETQPQRRSIPLTAPVSRDVPTPSGQRQASTKITLTPEERQIARTSFTAPDMTDTQKEFLYAQNKAKLAKQRANGAYPQPERN